MQRSMTDIQNMDIADVLHQLDYMRRYIMRLNDEAQDVIGYLLKERSDLNDRIHEQNRHIADVAVGTSRHVRRYAKLYKDHQELIKENGELQEEFDEMRRREDDPYPI